jgi:arylformamidase
MLAKLHATTRFIEVGHKGTTLSCPESVTGIDAIVLESVGPVPHAVNVTFEDLQVRGKAVLIRTGWDEWWGTDAYNEPGPYLHEELILRLIDAGVRLVGVDFGNVDRTELVAKDIIVVENMRNLRSLPKSGFLFHANRTHVALRALAEVTV